MASYRYHTAVTPLGPQKLLEKVGLKDGGQIIFRATCSQAAGMSSLLRPAIKEFAVNKTTAMQEISQTTFSFTALPLL